MQNLFVFLFLLSILALVLGIIKPSLIKHDSRGKVIKRFGIAIIAFLILLGITGPDPATDETQPQDQSPDQPETEYKLKIEYPGKWRGVYGNSKGVEVISGQGNKKLNIKPAGQITATFQKLGNTEQLTVILNKNDEILKKTTIEDKYASNSMFYGESKDLKISNGKLNPNENNDNDLPSLLNSIDPLPNKYGNVTESEYKKLVTQWSNKTVPIIDKAINIVKQFNSNQITKKEYFNRLDQLSSTYKENNEFKAGDMEFIYGPAGIDNIIPPEKIHENDYFYAGLSLLDSTFQTYGNEDTNLNTGYMAKGKLEDTITNINKSYKILNLAEVKELSNKIKSLKSIIPNQS